MEWPVQLFRLPRADQRADAEFGGFSSKGHDDRKSALVHEWQNVLPEATARNVWW